MPDTPSVRIVKSFDYRGTSQRWSNRYHFNGGVPSSNAAWETLFDAVVAAELPVICETGTIFEAVGYLAGATVSAHAKIYGSAGEYPVAPGGRAPGDCAALVKYATTARTSKNHPIYLFNYYHGVNMDIADPDVVANSQVSALQAYAESWIAGFSDGTNTLVRAGPNGATATSAEAEQWITHRDFPR